MKSKRLVVVLFLKESIAGTGVYEMEDQIVNGHPQIVEAIDNYLTKLTKDCLTLLKK